MRIERKINNLSNISENALYLTLLMCPTNDVNVIGEDSRIPFLVSYVSLLLVLRIT